MRVRLGLRGNRCRRSLGERGRIGGGKRTFERKSIPMVAWYMLSKESYMKRVINEVFPTLGDGASASCFPSAQIAKSRCIPLCSPRNTNLDNGSLVLATSWIYSPPTRQRGLGLFT